MASRTHDPEPLLTPAEVASMIRVDPKTVTRWAKAGKLSAIRTLGGHRSYRDSEVRALLQGQIPTQRQGDCKRSAVGTNRSWLGASAGEGDRPLLFPDPVLSRAGVS